MNFVDRVAVVFQAGNGGDGVVSFRHEKFRQFGGPDGGDGGNGGDIILVASNQENTLSAFRYKKLIKGGSGQSGSRRKKHGKNAPDLEVLVPVGTTVVKGDETVADLTQEGQREPIVKGGQGGFGNTHFVSSTRQAPRVAEKGEPGETVEVTLELKMIADVGIVGLPNAGKSTLLSVISNARPEIADYPFTTLKPNLGVVDIDGKTSLLVADIPGLIEGASQGKGLGDEFLRHVERTRLLVHLIDVYQDNIAAAYKTIRGELKDYKVDLSQRPQIVALTKIEGMPKPELNKKLKVLADLTPNDTSVLAISSRSGEGVKELLRQVNHQVSRKAKIAKPKSAELPVIGLKDDDNSWQVTGSQNGFLITGSKIEKFARRTRFGDLHGEQRLIDIMAKMGIMKELERAKAKPGDSLTVGSPAIGEIKY